MNLIIEEKKIGPKRTLKVQTSEVFPSEFTPEKWWLEDDAFLLGFDNFSGENSLLNFGRLNVFNCVVKGDILPKKIC